MNVPLHGMLTQGLASHAAEHLPNVLSGKRHCGNSSSFGRKAADPGTTSLQRVYRVFFRGYTGKTVHEFPPGTSHPAHIQRQMENVHPPTLFILYHSIFFNHCLYCKITSKIGFLFNKILHLKKICDII